MELKKHLAETSQIFAARFPALGEITPIYLLAFILRVRDNENIFAYNSLINEEVLRKIAEFWLDEVHDFTQDQLKEICEYLIEECLEIVKEFINLPRLINFAYLLAETEPQAVTREVITSNSPTDSSNSTKVSVEEIADIISEHIEKGIHIISYPPFDYIINSSKLSNEGWKKITFIWIGEAARIGKQDIFAPAELNQLLVEIATPQPNQAIYSPSCGIGSLFIEFKNRFPNHNLSFWGETDNPFLSLLCKINMLANDIEGDVIANSLTTDPYHNTYYESLFVGDVTVAILPFRMRVNKDELNPDFWRNHPKISKAENVFLEVILNNHKDNFKAVFVVTDSFLFSKQSKFYREKYINNDWIERIISLPQDTFKPDLIKTSIVVFNKNKSEKGFVFFDGKDVHKFEETKVSVDEILSTGNYNLQASRYALKESKEVTSILSKYSPSEVKKIKDLVVSAISGKSPNNRIVENSSEVLPYVRVADLSTSETFLDLDISKVERRISREKARKIIDFPTVLVSKIAHEIKPTFFNYTGQPIVIGSDVLALRLKEDVNTEYFLTQLYSRPVRIQVEMMSSGTTINRISTEDFLNIQIVLPPLEEQQRQVLAIRGVIEEKVIAEEKLDVAQFEVVANINHSLKNKLAVIINDYDTLLRFLRRKERKNETINFADAISANAVGDDIDTVEIITNRLKTNLSDASKVFNNALKIQKQNLKKDVVELVSFFKNEVKPLYAGKNYSIEVIAKPNLKLNVWLDKDAFKDVIENLIENAKSHGFVDDDKIYRIIFELSKLKDDEYFDESTSTKFARIVYKNDGKPFPKNFSFDDYKQFSNKAGRTQGTGIGGYIINKMIELHDGQFNFIPPSDDFTVEFEILLPLEN